MGADLFISYAWGDDSHRKWVRLLAAHMKAIGYDVLIDEDVDYGDSLTGFMGRVVDCRHVLLVVDDKYAARVDTVPDSGVAIENRWIASAHATKPETWLSVLFKDNPGFLLPAWLAGHRPRGHDFQVAPFPGSEQVEELWRWIEGLPANRDHAITAAKLRARAARLEVIDRQRDPSSWSNPALEDEVMFEYGNAPNMTYKIGLAEFGFALQMSARDANSVYVYRDPIHAVGLNRSRVSDLKEISAQISPGRFVEVAAGEQAILQNEHGALCLVDVLEVQSERVTPTYIPASVRIRYRVLPDS